MKRSTLLRLLFLFHLFRSDTSLFPLWSCRSVDSLPFKETDKAAHQIQVAVGLLDAFLHIEQCLEFLISRSFFCYKINPHRVTDR